MSPPTRLSGARPWWVNATWRVADRRGDRQLTLQGVRQLAGVERRAGGAREAGPGEAEREGETVVSPFWQL